MLPGDPGPGDSGGVVGEKAGTEFLFFRLAVRCRRDSLGTGGLPAGKALAKHGKQFL